MVFYSGFWSVKHIPLWIRMYLSKKLVSNYSLSYNSRHIQIQLSIVMSGCACWVRVCRKESLGSVHQFCFLCMNHKRCRKTDSCTFRKIVHSIANALRNIFTWDVSKLYGKGYREHCQAAVLQTCLQNYQKVSVEMNLPRYSHSYLRLDGYQVSDRFLSNLMSRVIKLYGKKRYIPIPYVCLYSLRKCFRYGFHLNLKRRSSSATRFKSKWGATCKQLLRGLKFYSFSRSLTA